MASGSPVRPSQTTMSTSFTPLFLISVRTCSQYFAPSPTCPPVTRGGLPGPQPEDVAAALAGHRERDVDRSVGDLPVADLHVDRVDEHHRIDRLSSIGGRERS